MQKYEIKDKESFERFSEKFLKKIEKFSVEEKVNKAAELIKENNINEAYNLLKELIKDFEAVANIKNSSDFAIYSFNSPIEHILKVIENKKSGINQEMMWLKAGEQSYCNIYYYFAYALIEMQKFDEAQDILEKALLWNPVSAACYSELADIALRKNNIEQAEELLHKVLEYAFDTKLLASCYRRLGYCCTEKKEYELALFLYVHSRCFEKNNPTVTREICYIYENADRKINLKPNPNYQEEVLLKNGIPYEASDLVKASICKMIEFCKEQNDFEKTEYYISLFSKVTTNKKYK